ncbi:MAG TPA: thioesterase family protein [Bacteroidota bacterium]|nr:thioesterase family protein [Bacteroidota bacterium]
MTPNEGKPLFIQLPFEPKTYDIDFAAHVSNIVYIRWLEDLRMKLLDTYLPLAVLMERGISPVVTQTVINYKRPVKIFDAVSGAMWGKEAGNVKWALSAEFSVRGTIVTTAEQLGVFVRIDNGRPAPFPEELRREFTGLQKTDR